MIGQVQFFNKTRGYGYIAGLDGSFMFYDDESYEQGDVVYFEMSSVGPKGPMAINVTHAPEGTDHLDSNNSEIYNPPQ